ncbi:hypothetical protein [Kitasatospora sp. NPDC051914]|uniref:hypothetical protein n=1 Tax=Kitasatospora sp. NPDC051914 TaxID=3154945 RepID=UPI00343E380A
MAEFLEFEFADGQSVRLRTFPVDGPATVADPEGGPVARRPALRPPPGGPGAGD